MNVAAEPAEKVSWTLEKLVDELFLNLARKVKYHNQANDLMYRIPVSKPGPKFVINQSDLDPRVIKELQGCTDRGFQYALRQAVGRVFENIDFEYYQLSVARFLKVRIEP
jgi:hypothetical protein